MNRASLPVHLRPIATRRLGIVAVCLSLAIATGCSSSSHPDGTHSGANESNASNESSRPDDGFDVRAENAKPGTRAWQIGADEQADDTQLAGFVDHDSIAPGTKLTLKATTQASRFDITAYRMGWYGGAQGREVAKRTNIAAISQPKPQVKAGNEVDASNWKPNATLDTAGWAPGLYLLKLTADVGGKPKAKWIPLVVRSTSLKGKLGIVYATPTYQAYNEWGGWSLYHGPNGSRATHVSFDRPYDRSGARLVTGGERQVTALAEKQGLDVGYASQLDVDHTPSILDGARGLVSLNHDEYWSVPMRDAWEMARDHGTNVAFLGANASYWRIRTEGRTIVGYKAEHANDPVQGPTTTAMWRSNPAARPENSLTGQLYECFPARGGVKVTEPNFFLFDGTGAKAGDTYDGLLGTEIDRAYPIAGTPSSLEVVAHSPVQCATKGRTYGDMAYYTTPSGSGVFSTGSMSWAVGVLGRNLHYNIDDRSSAFATKVTGNLLTAMAAGPMGSAHPSTPNLTKIGASPDTSTGTGGPIGTSGTEVKDDD